MTTNNAGPAAFRRSFRAWLRSRRYWDRMTALVALFGLTGAIEGEFPQSIMFVGPPGRGKSRLLLRFRTNLFLSPQSDLTVRQLYPLLRLASRGTVTHIIAPELQKFFQRKSSVADNCISTLALGMSEGVSKVSVGPRIEDFHGAQLGMLCAITSRTMRRRSSYLDELGFLDRTAVIPWAMSDEEIRSIMGRITRGNRSDIAPILLPWSPALGRLGVRIPLHVGTRIKDYVWRVWRGESLRPLERLRSLTQAAALVRGRRVVRPADWAVVLSYHAMWEQMAEYEVEA